jgi:hypothetical protein
MSTKRLSPGSLNSGERCTTLRWSVISISSPGRMLASMLPAALVCTSTCTPGGGQVRMAPFMPSGFAGFIGVFAAGQHQHFGAADAPGTQQPGMAANGQCGKGRQLGIGHVHRVGHDIGKRPPARTQQHGDAWRARAQPGAQRGGALFGDGSACVMPAGVGAEAVGSSSPRV